MTDTATFDEMLERARLIDPRATVALNHDGCFLISIPTDVTETYALPERFDGTPAAEAFRELDGGEGALDRWGRKNGHGDAPLVVVAEYYNLRAEEHALHREWLCAELARRGLRDYDTISDLHIKVTDAEREVLREYLADGGPAQTYANERLRARYERLWALWF